MARGAFPSITALLGLLAVAGYQNRDKLAGMLDNRTGSGADTGPGGGQARPDGLAGVLGGLAGSAGGGGLGSLLGGGLSELTDRFRQTGHGETADSWIGAGPNKTVQPRDLEQAIGPDVLDDLTEQTGLSREELLARLSRELPSAVDQYTPDGRLPNEDDMRG